jgi:hypothetical protein
VTVVSVGSVRSCGATTLALGLAATWPTHRRALLVEADPAGGTLAAASGWAAEPSLVTLAAAVRRSEAVELAFEHTHALPNGASVLAAPGTPEQSRRALAMLAGLFDQLGKLDGDVVLDCGRLDVSRAPEERRLDPHGSHRISRSNTEAFLEAEVALVACRPQLADLHAVASFLEHPIVTEARRSAELRVVLIGDGPYPAAEIASTFDVEVVAHLPFDAQSAAALPRMPADARELRTTPLVRALRSLASSLAPEVDISSSTESTRTAEVRSDLRGLRRFRQAAHIGAGNGNGNENESGIGSNAEDSR